MEGGVGVWVEIGRGLVVVLENGFGEGGLVFVKWEIGVFGLVDERVGWGDGSFGVNELCGRKCSWRFLRVVRVRRLWMGGRGLWGNVRVR